MVEKINKTSNKKIVMISALLMIIILIIGFTYAYWTRNFTQSGTNISKYKCFNVTYKENVEGITLENGYPISDEEGLQQEPYEVEIENTCETVASYNVVLNKMNTTTVKDEYIKIGMNEEVKKLSELNTIDSTLENASYGKILKTGVLGVKESTTISVRSWMDIDTPEEEGTNKIFENKITIESVAGNKQLAALILANNELKTTTIDYKIGEPQLVTYKESITKDYVYNSYNEATIDNLHNSKTGTRILGSSYTFNETTGKYTLTDTTNNTTIDNNSIGKYTCMNASTSCIAMVKIKEVDTTSNATFNYVTKADKYLQGIGTTSKNSGLYKAEDDDGDSYYFRGDIKNNYVSFANILWRIVRINGDKTIRLVKDESISESKFNEVYDNKYFGYTYDNDHICTKQNPCLTTTGTSSTIKTNLENWYTTNLNNYDDKIALESFCNDTSNSSTNAINKSNPVLTCADTTENYGGNYKLKIGILNAHEVTMAGIVKQKSSNKNPLETNFIYKKNPYWTLTPSSDGIFLQEGGSLSIDDNNVIADIYPVINLNSDIKVISGNGTLAKPYIVD